MSSEHPRSTPPTPTPPMGWIEVRRHGPAYYVFMVLGVLLLIGSLLVNVALFAVLAFQVAAGKLREDLVKGEAEIASKIAIVSLEGLIIEGRSLLPGFPFSHDMVSSISKQLQRAADDANVKGVILEVDSPGGVVTTSDIIYQKIVAFKKEHPGKKVVVCMKSTATSGAYYVSMAGDFILAHPTTVTGSIGVIMSLTNIEGLYEKLGLKSVVIKSGPRKDMLSATRAMTEEERKSLQEIIDCLHRRFLEVVGKGREGKLDADTLSDVTDGSIFTAEQAFELGLIDQIGYLDDAFAEAKKLAGIQRAKLVRYREAPRFPSFLMRSRDNSASLTQLETYLAEFSQALRPQFLYLWMP